MQYIFYHYGDALFSAADASGVSVCDQASIIAQTSAGDPRYYDDGRMGLFGLTQSLIVQAAAGLGLGDDYSSYKYDATTNIRMGAWQLQQIGSSDISELAALYFSKLYGLSSDSEEAEYYATKVANYNKICDKLGLVDSKKKDELGESLIIEGTLAADSSIALSLGVSPELSLRTEKNDIFTNQVAVSYVIASLVQNGEDLDSLGSPYPTARWDSFEDYPFVQVLFSTTEDTISYRYLSPFVFNTGQLLEDTPVALVEGVLYVTYDSDLLGGALEFSFANSPNNLEDLDDFCTVEWHEDIAYGTCVDDGLPGFIVRNLLTEESAYGAFGTDYAKVQIEWNPVTQLEETS